MAKFKEKIQDGTISIPGLILKIVLIWFIFTFLVFPNVNLILKVFVKDGHFTLEEISKIMKSARAMKSLKNSFILAIASIVTVNISGILIVLFTEYFDIKGSKLLSMGFMSTLIYGGVVLVTGYKFVYGSTGIVTKVLTNIFPNLDPNWIWIGSGAVLFHYDILRNIQSYDVSDECHKRVGLPYDRGGQEYGSFPEYDPV